MNISTPKTQQSKNKTEIILSPKNSTINAILAYAAYKCRETLKKDVKAVC